jgi:hypothetical protein
MEQSHQSRQETLHATELVGALGIPIGKAESGLADTPTRDRATSVSVRAGQGRRKFTPFFSIRS